MSQPKFEILSMMGGLYKPEETGLGDLIIKYDGRVVFDAKGSESTPRIIYKVYELVRKLAKEMDVEITELL